MDGWMLYIIMAISLCMRNIIAMHRGYVSDFQVWKLITQYPASMDIIVTERACVDENLHRCGPFQDRSKY
jgi:hypothetical protein